MNFTNDSEIVEGQQVHDHALELKNKLQWITNFSKSFKKTDDVVI